MTQIIVISVVAFLVVTLLLVGLLLFAKAKLTPSGTVKININNGSKVIEVAPTKVPSPLYLNICSPLIEAVFAPEAFLTKE